MKKFWKRTEGFTLVELIVVIAILGILAGIGTVGYSGYVKKANMAADQQLASEIENALLLAYYNQQLKDPTTVVVYFDENNVAEATTPEGEAAMAAVFGSNWQNLRLAYSGWNEESGGMSLSELYNNIKDSSFDPNEETLQYLLGDVQNVVGVLAGAFNGSHVNIDKTRGLGKYLEDKGISVEAGNGQSIANGAVMYVADRMKNQLDSAEDRDSFATKWATSVDLSAGGAVIPEDVGLDNEFETLAAKYAYVEALASYVDAQTSNGNKYVTMLRTDTNTDGVSNGANMEHVLNQVMQSINIDQNNAAALRTYYGMSVVDGQIVYADPSTTAAYKDALAFTSYMQGLSANSESLIEQGGLDRADYYTDGKIQSLVTSYVNQGKELSDADMRKGAFAFYFNNDAVTVICLPLDAIEN